MRNRLVNLPNNLLVTTVKQLQTDTAQLRQDQRMTGASGVLTYLTQTANQWDYQGTISPGSVGIVASWNLLFTGDGSQEFPASDPFLNLFIDAPGQNQLVTNGTYTDSNGDVTVTNFIALDTTSTAGVGYLSDPLNIQWVTDLEINGTVTVYMKAFVLSTSPGTLKLTRTA